MNQTKYSPRFYLRITGTRESDHSEYSISLGPWGSISGAQAYSDELTNSRIGEQLLEKLGVTSLKVIGG